VAELMAGELGWDADRRQAEVAEYRRFVADGERWR
jgi:hypothetical protein